MTPEVTTGAPPNLNMSWAVARQCHVLISGLELAVQCWPSALTGGRGGIT